MRDMHNNVAVVNAIPAQLITDAGGDKNSGDIDLQGFGSCEFVASVGVSGDVAPVIQLKIEHADDDGTGAAGAYAACAATDLLGVTSIASGVIADADKYFDDGTAGHDIGSGDGTATSCRFGYIGRKRFVKITVDENGTNTNGTPVAVVCIKSNPANAPTA